MKNHLKNVLVLSLVSSIGIATLASADTPAGSDYTTPYIDPQQDCLTGSMSNPHDKEFRYLFSRDCRVVHVLPPPVMKQSIVSQGVNLNACAGLASTRNTLNTIDLTIDQASERVRRLEAELEKARPAQEKAILAKIDDLNKRIEGYNQNKAKAIERFERDYAALPGAIFSVVMNDNVSQTDLNEIRSLNDANLNRRRTVIEKTIGPDGKETIRQREEIIPSVLRAAKVSESYYSFLYRVPSDATKNGGLISTDIPNLQYLQQPGERTGVIHVKANGGISGQVILSVTRACDNVKPDANKKLVFDDSTDPVFTVNRTFFVQQMFAQGYVAKLKIDKVIEQITKHTVTHRNSGFEKSSVFLPSIKANVEEILDFKWASEFDTGKNISFEKVLEIKNGVAAKLIDDYVETLLKAGVLKAVADKIVDPANGGYVGETRVANRCWTEKDGGVSGFFGGRHRVCADYTYVVQVWKDGMTTEDVTRKLNLNVEASDSMAIFATTPFYFTTAFIK